MWKRMIVLIALLASSTMTGAWAQGLGVGDPAPALAVKEFVKGTPISSLEKGKIYVVEFWATWCGPCRTSIPHLTELQKKYPDTTFIGVSVFERDPAGVKPFVQEMGDKMAYRVAMDDVPAGAGPDAGKMAKNWMQASGQNGIPTAFIVDKETKIAWIGHPMAMDKPLEQVVAGTFDRKAAVAQQQQAETQQKKLQELQGKLAKAQQSGDPKQMLAVIDQAIADEPALEMRLGIGKFFLLATQVKDVEKAQAYGNHLIGSVYKDNPEALNELAWSIVAPGAPKPTPGVTQVALKAATRADELTQGKNAAIADTLAKAYFDSGNAVKAFETQERAVRLAKGTPAENEPGLKERLEQYRKAAGK